MPAAAALENNRCPVSELLGSLIRFSYGIYDKIIKWPLFLGQKQNNLEVNVSN